MKINLVNEIRKLLKINRDSRDYFTKEEIAAIVSAIDPTVNFDSLEYRTALSSTISGWQNQKTIETHPTIENLNVICDLLKNDSYRLETLISMIDEELLSKSKAIRFENNILTIELK
jgi:allophanate hydrolase subunit 1